MKNILITGLDGSPMKQGEKQLTLKDVAVDILLITEQEQTGASKLECGELARKLWALSPDQETKLSAEEVVLLKKRLEKYASTLVWMQCQHEGVIE